MGDVVFIAVMIVFFLLCTLYVQLCDRLIGPDELTSAGQADADPANVSGVATVGSVGGQVASGVSP